MGDYGGYAWQPGATDDSVLTQEEVDEFMSELQREAPHLLLGYETPPAAAVGLATLTSLPLPPSPPTTDLPSLQLQRSNSKRPRADDDNHDHKGKRNRKIPGGFLCEEDGCDKKFDRVCDLSKHQKRVHTSKEERTHQCPQPQCTARFCWPKDVRRHLGQVHGIHVEQSDSLAIRGKPNLGLSLVIKQEPQDIKNVEMTGVDTATSPTGKSHTMAWLTRSVLMLKKLRLRSKSIDENDADDFILVTLDKQDYRMVDVKNVDSVDALTRQIATTFNIDEENRSNNFILHKFRRGSKIGDKLAGDTLMAAISKTERAKRTLRLFLTLRNGATPSTSFFGGMPTVNSP